MKFARLRVARASDPLTPVHAAVTDCPGVDVVQVRFGGVAASGPLTYVLSVAGSAAALDEALAAEPGVLDHEVVYESGRHGLVYVRSEPSAVELSVRATLNEGSLLSTPPIDVYPDGSVIFRVLGAPDDLGAAVESVSGDLSVTVERVGEYDRPPERVAAALTDRQTEVVRTALDLGYYDVPREVTHEDVADAVGCAPSTVSEHLRKAEAALVRAAFRR